MDYSSIIISVASFAVGYYFKQHGPEEKKKKSTIKQNWDGLAKNPNDVWTTPIDVVKSQIKYVGSLFDDVEKMTWIDPFKHTGNYYDNFPAGVTKEWAEITEGRCALDVDYNNKIVVSNPPYSILEKLIKKMTGDGHHGEGAAVISLLILSNHLTAPRLQKIKDAGYKIVDIKFINIKGWWAAARVTWVWAGYDVEQTIGVDYKRGGNRN